MDHGIKAFHFHVNICIHLNLFRLKKKIRNIKQFYQLKICFKGVKKQFCRKPPPLKIKSFISSLELYMSHLFTTEQRNNSNKNIKHEGSKKLICIIKL